MLIVVTVLVPLFVVVVLVCLLPPRFAGREVAVFSVDSADNSDECETGAASGSSSYSREAELSCARGESSDWPSSRW